MQKLYQSTWGHEVLCADRTTDDEQNCIIPLKNQNKKYERGEWLKIKIHIYFYRENS
jgi:hypothetical protein